MDFEKSQEELVRFTQNSILIEGFSLDRITAFMEYLGNPHKKLRYVHIAGTSGKGSTTTYTEQILRNHGLKTGSFFSPHMISVTERIRINGQMVSKDEFARAFTQVRKAHDEFFQDSEEVHLIYFEVLLAMAILIYVEHDVDVAVIEVGLGGTLDPTNIIPAEVAVLTSVGLDHQEFLGDTIEEIASDKLGITKQNVTLVCGASQSSIKDLAKKVAAEKDATLLQVGEQFSVTEVATATTGTAWKLSVGESVTELSVAQIGAHQATNASVAFMAAKAIMGGEFSPETAATALQQTNLHGRVEFIPGNPSIVIDVAHNADKMGALVSALQDTIPDKKIRLIIGFKQGRSKTRYKEAVAKLKALKHRLQHVYICDFAASQDIYVKSVSSEKVKKAFDPSLPGIATSEFVDARAAFDKAVTDVKEDELIVVTGSFYLISYLEEVLPSVLDAT